MEGPNVYKVIVMVDGRVSLCGAIDYEGAIWLVPKWIPFPDEGYAKPERMFRLDQFQHQVIDPPATGPGPLAGANFGINEPLPKKLFFGKISPKLEKKYGVQFHPNVKFRTGGMLS